MTEGAKTERGSGYALGRGLVLLVRGLLLLLALVAGVFGVFSLVHVFTGHVASWVPQGLVYGLVAVGSVIAFGRLGRWSNERWPRPIGGPPATITPANAIGTPRHDQGETTSPLTNLQRFTAASGVPLALAIGAVLALVAAIGGAALANHYEPLDGLCNGAYQSGIPQSTSQNVDCGVDTTLYSLGHWLHIVGVVALVVGAIALVGALVLAPKFREDLRRLGR